MSKYKIVVVQLASLNHLQLKHSKNDVNYVVRFNNHEIYNKPELIEKNGFVEIKVIEQQHLLQSQQNKYRAGQPLFPNYIIEIPKEIEVKIVYKKGNFSAEDFVGNLDVYLDHGNVNLVNFKGSTFIQAYAGVINCELSNVLIDAETTRGTIDAQLDDQQLSISKTSVNGVYGSPLNKLKIKSISGKINLRPLADK